jgi:putative DNA primase/helicase
VIATGHEAPVIAQGKSEEEMEKRLGAALIAGHQLISLDNCKHPLGGQQICQALTQRLVDVRVLGKSKLVTVPNAALFFATGNNLLLIDDMPRRAVIGRLDARTERSELREFETEDPVVTLKRERPRYVAAALTVLRAFIAAGGPEQRKQLGSFEEWSRLVRDALIWVGEPDPVHTMERVREQDPQRAALAAVLEQWNAIVGTKRASAKELIDHAIEFDPKNRGLDVRRFRYPEFREALLAVAGDAGNINSRRLGKWLSTNKDRIVNSLRIIADGTTEGIARYRLQRLVEGRWE